LTDDSSKSVSAAAAAAGGHDVDDCRSPGGLLLLRKVVAAPGTHPQFYTSLMRLHTSPRRKPTTIRRRKLQTRLTTPQSSSDQNFLNQTVTLYTAFEGQRQGDEGHKDPKPIGDLPAVLTHRQGGTVHRRQLHRQRRQHITSRTGQRTVPASVELATTRHYDVIDGEAINKLRATDLSVSCAAGRRVYNDEQQTTTGRQITFNHGGRTTDRLHVRRHPGNHVISSRADVDRRMMQTVDPELYNNVNADFTLPLSSDDTGLSRPRSVSDPGRVRREVGSVVDPSSPTTTRIECDFPGCRRTFRELKHLKVHRMQHTDERPLACALCNYSCRQRNSLNWHMKSRHGLKNRVTEDGKTIYV
jgi:hypothetical protein